MGPAGGGPTVRTPGAPAIEITAGGGPAIRIMCGPLRRRAASAPGRARSSPRWARTRAFAMRRFRSCSPCASAQPCRCPPVPRSRRGRRPSGGDARVASRWRARACQRRRKNVPARRRKNVLRAGWELVPVVHGRDPRAGRRALRAAGGGPRVGGACGPTGPSGGLFGRLPAS